MKIDASLQSLVTEINLLSSILDSLSDEIKTIESCLRNYKVHFPFRFKISEETSTPRSPKDSHGELGRISVEYYVMQTCYYLAWEEDEESKQFRLLFVIEEEEIIGCTGMRECCQYTESLKITSLLKKPFVVTNLQTRLKYAEHLDSFINSFKDYLKTYRISIEKTTTDIGF